MHLNPTQRLASLAIGFALIFTAPTKAQNSENLFSGGREFKTSDSEGLLIKYDSGMCMMVLGGTSDNLVGITLAGERLGLSFTAKFNSPPPGNIYILNSLFDFPFSDEKLQKKRNYKLYGVNRRETEYVYMSLIDEPGAKEILSKKFISFTEVLSPEVKYGSLSFSVENSYGMKSISELRRCAE